MSDSSFSQAASSKPSLRRAVTGPMLFLFILGDVLGAGVYAVAGTIAGEVGGSIWVPLLVALCFAMLTAGSYAELATKCLSAGAASVFAEKAFKSPLISFLVGFCMLAAAVTSAAGLSLAFAGDYLAAFVDVPPHLAALIFLVVIALLNARGILAEEIRGVRKVYPRALFAALVTAGIVYMAVGVAASVVLSMDKLTATSAPLLEVVRASGLSIPPQLFAFIALVAVANGALLTMVMASRLAAWPPGLWHGPHGPVAGATFARAAQAAYALGRDHRQHPGGHRPDLYGYPSGVGRDGRAVAAFRVPQHQPGGAGIAPRHSRRTAFSRADLGAGAGNCFVLDPALPARPGHLVAR
ncbi:Amino acid permease-associated protein [Pseudomonas syringae pv. spinaceae]|uniref:Amino acid permease-associated protein n=1 Tax=Pseudomonas syringae pv. spinaceae TaxID=264459 RepID=A0A0N8T0J5_PSESX|nr:Amino acid permease-associated protein [Pseudomonas syringae pv. spinaceae]